MRKNKICLSFCAVLWILIVFIMFAPINLPFVDGNYSATRLLVEVQAVTGPDIRVLKGSEELREAIPLPHPNDLNMGEIELKGKSIYDWISYPDYYMFNYVVTGNYTELTTDYQETGAGTIPIFYAEAITTVGSLSSWTAAKLGATAVGSIVIILFSFLLWFLPIPIIYFAVAYRNENKKATDLRKNS